MENTKYSDEMVEKKNEIDLDQMDSEWTEEFVEWLLWLENVKKMRQKAKAEYEMWLCVVILYLLNHLCLIIVKYEIRQIKVPSIQ